MRQARHVLVAAVDVTHQQIILARLSDFCRYEDARAVGDLWTYLCGKIGELEDRLRRLKQEQLLWHRDRFIAAMRAGSVDETQISDFKTVLDGYLSPGDFADVAIHLSAQDMADPERRKWLIEVMQSMKAASLFDEARKPEDRQSSRAKKLLGELSGRLAIEPCEKALTRKPRTPRRRRMVLRRLRRNVAEYCSVLHFPTSPDDTFSPFLLPRVEALAAACQRFLERHR